MLVPLSWLKEFTPITTDASDRVAVRELGRVLDSLGLVVEGVEHVGAGLEEIVLARVLEISSIEGADRIRRVLVDSGDDAPLQIVCGAMNFVVGDVVPLAKVGTVLPGGMEIALRKMRGVTSNGMLCSGRELDIDDDADGLLILASTGGADSPLPEGVVPGSLLTTFLGIEPDAVFDLAIEPNRPDCLSVIGVARDLAAALRLPFHLDASAAESLGDGSAAFASIEIDEPEACPQMVGRVIRGVPQCPSPPRVARRLTLAGMRPINAIVDASNYVMLELGQPSHPYDLDALEGAGLRVRYARPGEQLVTLDGTERTLGRHTDAIDRTTDVEDLLICDGADRPVGIAGVMGGANTEIGATTTTVLLEVAEFAPLGVARTARRQGLRSEASARFERGIDPNGLERAANRFATLLLEAAAHAGLPAPVVAPGDLAVRAHPVESRQITLRVARANAVLGTAIESSEIVRLLLPIGFGFAAPETGGDAELIVTVPSFRPDVTREIDVIEEVARHYGYERITPTRRRSPNVGNLGALNALRRRIRRIATGLDAHEVWTSSIVDPELAARVGSSTPVVALANPMVHEESVLRSGLLAGLLGALRYNAGHRATDLRFFETGHVFAVAPGGEGLPAEREHVGMIFAGAGDDVAAALKAWATIADSFRLDTAMVRFDQSSGEEGGGPLLAGELGVGINPARAALLWLELPDGDAATALGAIGEVDPDVLVSFGLPAERRIGWLVLDLAILAEIPRKDVHARPVSRFPSSDIDLAFVLDDGVPAARLEELLRASAGVLGESVRLLDVYRGPGLALGTRSLAYRIRFCALDRTLTDAEVATLRTTCIENVERELPAKLRG